MKITILLIRHGKTKGNLEGRYIGSKTDEPLCQEGIKALFEKKQELSFDLESIQFTYSSPMKRAIESAHILFSDLDVKTVNSLKEIDFGDFENKNYQELNGNIEYQRWIDSNGRAGYPGGEELKAFISRSVQGFMEVISDIKEYDTSKAAIICHGGNIMAIMSSLTNKDYFDFQVKNGCGYKLELEVNDTKVDLISYSLI